MRFGFTQRRKQNSTVLRPMESPGTSTNLPVPVLAQRSRKTTIPSTETGIDREARESTRSTAPGLRAKPWPSPDSRGGQNTLSESVRDRTADFASLPDSENTLEAA